MFISESNLYSEMNLLPHNKILDLSELLAVTDNQTNGTQKKKKRLEFDLEKVENKLEKGTKCWSSAFSPFPIMFSKAICLRIVKSLPHNSDF